MTLLFCFLFYPYLDGADYHWYRMDNRFDNNGVALWSQKSGDDYARDFDDAGQLITDPRTADDSAFYDEFVGYMYSGPNVDIAGPVVCWREVLVHFFSCGCCPLAG